MAPFETLNYTLSLGTIALQIGAVAFFALFFLQKRVPDLVSIGNFLNRWGLWIGFVLSAAGVGITLYYSDVLGILPCGWCWFQRIGLYPQVALFGIALIKSRRSDAPKRDVADYSIALSVFGGLASLYQHYLQMGGNSLLPCPASGQGDCGQRFLFEFGYITFPLMAFSLFAFLIVLMLFVRKRSA